MHTVLVDECTGCDLCIPPCPVDCITMVLAPDDGRSPPARADHYRGRYVARNARLEREASERAAELAAKKVALADTRVSAVQAAILRVRAKKSGTPADGSR